MATTKTDLPLHTPELLEEFLKEHGHEFFIRVYLKKGMIMVAISNGQELPYSYKVKKAVEKYVYGVLPADPHILFAREINYVQPTIREIKKQFFELAPETFMDKAIDRLIALQVREIEKEDEPLPLPFLPNTVKFSSSGKTKAIFEGVRLQKPMWKNDLRKLHWERKYGKK